MARLLLDEMFDARIAARLGELGHDCLAVVADPAVRGISDDEVVAMALEGGRTLVTDDVADLERLRRDRAERGRAVPTLICTSDRTFPRDRRFVERIVAALDRAARAGAVTDAGGVLRLAPPPP